MNKGTTRLQHYVSQFLLRRFCGPEGRLWAYDTENQKVFCADPKGLAAEGYFYSDSTQYPTKASIAIEHYAELLDRLVAEGRLLPTVEGAGTVTYHDPCYLGRHSGIYEAPRRVLQSIPGLKLVEMANNRESSLCCGGGGGGAWSDDPPSQRFGVLRVREALVTGAEVIATACPYCIRMLNDGVRELGVGNQIVVRDLAELLLQSVVMRDEAAMTKRVALGFDREVCHV